MRLSPGDDQRSKKRLRDGTDGKLGLFYYLFSAHHWPLSELQRLWEGETKWLDLVNALSSFECDQRNNPPDRPAVKHLSGDKKNIKLTKLATEGGKPNA